MEGSASDHLVGDEPEPSLHLIEPGTAGRWEVEMKAAAFFGLKPTLDLCALVGAVVVGDEVDFEFGWYFLFQLIQKLDELFATMARQATADDFAVQDIGGGKQRRGPVPLVVMCLTFGKSSPQRQNRSGSVQCLNLDLFINAGQRNPGESPAGILYD